MHHLSHQTHRAVSSLRAMRVALILAGVFGLAVIAAQFSIAPTAQAAGSTFLHYQQGYYLDNGWLCLGWNSGAYHCTHHWHTDAAGNLISQNTAWVPNNVTEAAPAPVDVDAAPSVTYTAPAQHYTAPVQHYTAPVQEPSAPSNSGSVTGEIQAVFGPYAGQALNVARCESGFNPYAKSPISTASGVFQFLNTTWATTSYAGESVFNASANIHAAYQVFARDGYSWREWSCQP